MTPPLAVVEQRRALLATIAASTLAAVLEAVPADLLTWAHALRAREYMAWRHPTGEVTVIVRGTVGARPVRVHAVFTGPPAFMTRQQAATLPDFDGPRPVAVLEFPEAA